MGIQFIESVFLKVHSFESVFSQGAQLESQCPFIVAVIKPSQVCTCYFEPTFQLNSSYTETWTTSQSNSHSIPKCENC